AARPAAVAGFGRFRGGRRVMPIASAIPGQGVAPPFIVDVVPANRDVDLDRLADLARAHDVRLADEAELRWLYPDCEIGAMPPPSPRSRGRSSGGSASVRAGRDAPRGVQPGNRVALMSRRCRLWRR